MKSIMTPVASVWSCGERRAQCRPHGIHIGSYGKATACHAGGKTCCSGMVYMTLGLPWFTRLYDIICHYMTTWV